MPSTEPTIHVINKPPSEHIRKLLELILNRNCFQFGNKFYLQKIGCAMSSTASPEICDITLHDLENKILQQADHILTWWRYRDDILVLYSGELEDFKNLINTMNQLHPTLKFTYEAPKTSIDYLDLTIFKGKRFRETDILDTKVYTKPTETYQFLHRTSSHPPHVFKAFIFGETLRYARNTNNEDDFKEKVKGFSHKLLARGYTQTEINNGTHNVSLTNRTKLIHNLPQGKQRCETSNWHLIQQNPQLSEIFPKQPFFAFRKAQNIREKLIRAKLTSTDPNR